MKNLLSCEEDFAQIMDLQVGLLNPKEYYLFNQFCQKIDRHPEKYGVVELYEGMVSIPTYKTIRDLITFPQDTIIVDCGCGNGFQQIIFKDCYKYIGIDLFKHYTKICNNAEFIQGDICEIIPNMEFEENKTVFGISVLCGMCFMNVNKVMRDKFERIVIC